jgi:pimeloyl-[acyl-carrier protein] methyl ester esterase
MNLHVESTGKGAPLVLLHGWGMHGGIFSEVAPGLAEKFRVHSVDLPGYGLSRPAIEPYTLEAMADMLASRFADEKISVCGWSLGGQVALRWAERHPGQVARLVLVASTPCFVTRVNWPHGVAPHVLQQFATELTHDHGATLRRFLALQLQGASGERALLQRLYGCLRARAEPDLAALRGGLAILRDADLRDALARIAQPALIVSGARDKLTPPAASRYLAETLPDAALLEIADAAHVPFLSHPELFSARLTEFLHG